jgi:biopolymer transport protein ExbD
MAMNVGSSGDEDEVVSAINTTPLVDVMLVLLIIFLITIPVVAHTVPVALPKETNIARQTKPGKHRDRRQQGRRRVLEHAADRGHRGAVPAPEEDRRDDAAAGGPHPGRREEPLRVDRPRAVRVPARAIQKISFITEPPPKG